MKSSEPCFYAQTTNYSRKKIKKMMPFTITTKDIKYLQINERGERVSCTLKIIGH